MIACPLPIDWLDLLDGRPSVATRAHLDECASCRAVVDELTATIDERADDRGIQQLSAQHRRRATLTTNTVQPEVTAGQIWWLTRETLEQRLPVLIVAVAKDEDTSQPLVDVAPLWTDEDNATASDLLLNESDSTTGVRWRVAFRRQALIRGASLHALAGTLTASGQVLLNEALAGHIQAERRGTELESDNDPRLVADAWMDRILAGAAASVNEDDEGAELPAVSETLTAAGPSVDLIAIDSTSGKALVFELKLRRDTAGAQSHKLAAASPIVGKSVTEASLRDEATGIRVTAVLWADYRTDELLLRPQEVHGVDRPVRFVVRSPLLASPVTVEALLEVGRPVTLTTGEPISELDVQELEMYLE